MAMPDLHFMGYWRWKLRAWFVSEKDIGLKTNKQTETHPKIPDIPKKPNCHTEKKSAVQFKPKYFIFMYLYLAEIVNHNLMVNKKIESFLSWFLPSLFHTLLLSQPNSRRVISYITQFRFVSCASGRKEGGPNLNVYRSKISYIVYEEVSQ